LCRYELRTFGSEEQELIEKELEKFANLASGAAETIRNNGIESN